MADQEEKQQKKASKDKGALWSYFIDTNLAKYVETKEMEIRGLEEKRRQKEVWRQRINFAVALFGIALALVTAIAGISVGSKNLLDDFLNDPKLTNVIAATFGSIIVFTLVDVFWRILRRRDEERTDISVSDLRAEEKRIYTEIAENLKVLLKQ